MLTGPCVQDYDFPLPFTASPEMTAKGRRWARLLSEMLVKINLRPNPVLIMPRGLAGIPHGYQYMSEGKVRIHRHNLNLSFFYTEGVVIILGKRREDYLQDRRYNQRVRGAVFVDDRKCGSRSRAGLYCTDTLVVSPTSLVSGWI